MPKLMRLGDATEMAEEIKYVESVIESVVGRLKEDFGGADEPYSSVEGAGSTIRESSGGVRGGDVDQIVAGSGLPLKK